MESISRGLETMQSPFQNISCMASCVNAGANQGLISWEICTDNLPAGDVVTFARRVTSRLTLQDSFSVGHAIQSQVSEDGECEFATVNPQTLFM